jgi:hypothetical protein
VIVGETRVRENADGAPYALGSSSALTTIGDSAVAVVVVVVFRDGETAVCAEATSLIASMAAITPRLHATLLPLTPAGNAQNFFCIAPLKQAHGGRARTKITNM